MYFKLKKIFLKIKQQFFLNKDEVFFLKNIKFKKNYNKKKTVCVSMVADYYHLIYLHYLIGENKINPNSVIAIWPYNIFQIDLNKKNYFLSYFKFKITNYLLKRKWKKLYSAIGIKQFDDYEISNFFYLFYISLKLYKIFKIFFKSEKTISKYSYKSIRIGDLILDTYIRFGSVPYINKKVFFLKYLFFKSLIAIEKLEKIFKKNNISIFYFSYISYIQNGIPARFSIKKKIEAITLYSNTGYNKKLTQRSCTHIENITFFKKNFFKNNKNNKKNKLNSAENILKEKFQGKNNIMHAMPYLNKNPYYTSNKLKINNLKFDGVLFLHDFFDSTTIYRPFVFENYYSWVLYTLKLITNYNLQIAVKPHPNSIIENKNVIENLKKNFPSIIWIDKTISNLELFSRIKFGISLHGSVLYEMAYHGIIPISAGARHHSVDYNFVFTAKSKKHYKKLILNINSLKMPKNYKSLVREFYYVFALQDNDYFQSSAKKYNLKKFLFKESGSLVEYTKLINDKNFNSF